MKRLWVLRLGLTHGWNVTCGFHLPFGSGLEPSAWHSRDHSILSVWFRWPSVPRDWGTGPKAAQPGWGREPTRH